MAKRASKRKAAGKSYPSSKISSEKAKKILEDGTVHGRPLTPAQKRMMGAAAGKSKKR